MRIKCKATKPLVERTLRGTYRIYFQGDLFADLAMCFDRYLKERPAALFKINLSKDLPLNTLHHAVVMEIYNRYFGGAILTPIRRSITLKPSEALALWYVSQKGSEIFLSNPQLGNLFMQLHQRLSSQ